MSCLIGVLSYLPENDVKLRETRLNACLFQNKWLRELLPNTPELFIAQAYASDELPNDDCIQCITFDKGIGAAPARNIILKQFYNSNYDWLLMCDDDTVLDNKYHYENFIHDIIDHPDKFSGIDAVSAIEPEYHPYKKLNYQDKANLTHYKFEPREINSGSATSIIRNLKKYYNDELYFPDIDTRTGIGRHDMEFLMLWMKKGYTWYNMDTMIRKSLCFDKSSLFGTDTKARDKLMMKCNDSICERYASDGLQRGTNGKITWAAYNAKYNKTKKVLYIPREVPIEYEENVIPKEKQYSKKLF